MAAAYPSNSAPARLAADQGVFISWERFEWFVGQFTHDVRNGLNALELQLTFLGEIATDQEAIEEVKRLRSTLSDVTRQLQATKMATGPVHPNVLEYPAVDLFEDLRERLVRLQPDATKKTVWKLAEDASISLLVDPDLTIGGLIELFINSSRFGSLSVQCTTANESEAVVLTLEEILAVAPASPPEQWGRVPLLSSRRGAYGLGLFRVNRIMEAQGATMSAAYSAEKNLLTTTVTLPRTPGTTPR